MEYNMLTGERCLLYIIIDIYLILKSYLKPRTQFRNFDILRMPLFRAEYMYHACIC